MRATFNCPRPELKTRTKKGRLKTSAHVSHSPNTQPFVAVSYCSNSERISSLLRLIASAKNHHEQQRKGLLSIAKQTRSLPWGSDRRHQQIKHGARGSAGVVGHESGNHRRSCGHFRNGQLCNSCSRLVPGKVATDRETAGHYAADLDWLGAVQDIAGAAKYLKEKGGSILGTLQSGLFSLNF